YMAFGRNGHLGVYVHSHVVEAKELGRGHVYLPSMGEDHVMARKHNINLAILHSALIKEHLAKGQRTLAGDGMSQVTKTLLDLTQRKNFYAGDLLVSVEILRNVTDTFKRASYIPASDGVQNFFQIISNLLDEENKEKWEDAQQIYPGSVELMQVIEDFIHIVGMGMMDFQNSYLMTGNVDSSDFDGYSLES
ncbi:hypothetical protein Q9233_009581, partial [Columba guinea]